jgi:hypothetical protein
VGWWDRCEKRHFLRHLCIIKTDHFTKTGSGQTQEKLRKECRFSLQAILEASVATTATYNMSQFGLTAAEEATERAKWKNAAEFYASTKVMDMSCEYAKCVSVLLLGLLRIAK